MDIFGRRLIQRQIQATQDQVVAHYPLPNGCTLKNVWLDVHAIIEEEILVTSAVLYGLSGFVCPVLDPDSPSTTVDNIWDALVPKDVALSSGVFDIDTGATDTSPEFNFGEMDITGLFGVAGNQPLEIFRRRELVTVASHPQGYQQKDAAVDAWAPLIHFKSQVKRQVQAATHSHVLFGWSSPDTTQTTTTVKAGINEDEWVLMTYLETFLEQAWISMMGLVQAGAETPYVDIATFVAELLEDTALEISAGAFAPATWRAFVSSTFQVDVPGRFKMGALSSEG